MGLRDIVDRAVMASNLTEAHDVQALIKDAVGGSFERPVADRWNNAGLMMRSGSYDHKIMENITNMQDAILERFALQRHGDRSNVPYASPMEAVKGLFEKSDYRELASKATVEFRESDPPASSSRRITIVFRDHGCGMRPKDIPDKIFYLGTSNKTSANWFQGAFGLGGTSTFPNAEAVVLVTRPSPEMINSPDEDMISIAVLQRRREGKQCGLYYLVDRPWASKEDIALPFSMPSSEFPEFEPGTHLALISYQVEGFHRQRGGGDERSFEAVFNTRLFRPVTPVRFINRIVDRKREADYLRGLHKRLLDNPRDDRTEGEEVLPYHIGGKTHHLPIRFWVFSKPTTPGEKRNFVAYDHAVIFTSNGQAHKHWSPQEFRSRTNLNKLDRRILIEVETDELPIEDRGALFTPDRTAMVGSEAALKLEEQVAAFLDDWEELIGINNKLIQEAIRSTDGGRSTIQVARQISRALKVKGFSFKDTGGTRHKNRRIIKNKIDVYPDPTTLEGPEEAVAEIGKTKCLSYVLNAVNDFIPRRGKLEVLCTHPDIKEREITIGQLRSGCIRVCVAVPISVQQGDFSLTVSLSDWTRASGGLGPEMNWTTKLTVVEEIVRKPPTGTGNGTGDDGGLVALIWKTPEAMENWSKNEVGDVEMIPAEQLALAQEDYAELKKLGDTKIPTLILNSEYPGLKRYLGARARDLSRDDTIMDKRDQYAVGVGVGLLILDEEERQRKKAEKETDDDYIKKSKEAIARSVLSMMPEFDRIVREAGLED